MGHAKVFGDRIPENLLGKSVIHAVVGRKNTRSWKEDKDCCTWDGVVCDNSTRHVIALDLSCSWLNGSIPSNISEFDCILTYLIPVFLVKSHMKSPSCLRLFLLIFLTTGTFEMNVFRLPCIQTLDLRNNYFLEGSLPKSNLSSSSLKFLSLYMTNSSGELPDSIGSLKSLEYLYLNHCNFTGAIPTSLGNLTQMIYLDLLYNNFNDLHHNQLVGPLPNHVSGLNLLIDLSLSSNFLNGTLSSWLFNLTSLVKLTLDQNQFIGEIGEFKLVNLTTLDLSSNNLQGSIPSSISRLVKLTSLSLSSNNLSIMLDLEMFSNLNNLYVFNFSYNNLLVSINNNLTFTLPNLKEMYLSSCNISEFPIFLRIATNLQHLDLSNNRIHGPFPTLNALDLHYLFASNNNLSGGIPSLICNASSLEVLDLSHNNFSGTIPKCLVLSNVLSVLDLRMNSLNGSIPATFSCGNYLRNINLNGNQLEGPLPRSLEYCTNLEVLDLGNNKINETFPYWLGSILELQVLVIRSNKFRGRIGNPKTQFPFLNLQILDISNNDFNGLLPRKYFKYLKAMMNVDEGKVGIQTVFTIIDFSNNSFIGKIPQIIGSLNSLKGLNFSHNNLIGYIPSSFGHLTNLEWLDLSFNKLDGEIPKQLEDLNQLAVLELSHNQLSGPIPSGKQFNTFENNSYTNNLGLCGFPLTRTCNNHKSKQPPPSILQQENNLEPKNGFVIFGTLMGYLMFEIGKPKWIVRMLLNNSRSLCRQ
ncbi:hypothetical protein ACB092_08G148400 [Castanea dentata]